MLEEPEFGNADQVERLIDPELSGERLWEEHELREVLEHQLAAPLVVDLHELGSVQALTAVQLCDAADPQIRTFRDLFEHPAPPHQLLSMVRRLAQSQLIAPEPQLPPLVAKLLYFYAFAITRMNSAVPNSDLSDSDLLKALEWLAAQSWVDANTQARLRNSATTIRGGPDH